MFLFITIYIFMDAQSAHS